MSVRVEHIECDESTYELFATPGRGVHVALGYAVETEEGWHFCGDTEDGPEITAKGLRMVADYLDQLNLDEVAR